MKVALFVYHFPARSETFIVQQALALVRAGIDLSIITQRHLDTWDHFDSAIRDELKGRVVALPSTARSRWPQAFLQTLASRHAFRLLFICSMAIRFGPTVIVREIPRWLKTGPIGKFDAIVTHFGPIGVEALILRRAGLISGPILTVFHGYDMSRKSVLKKFRRGYKAVFSQTELLLAISQLWSNRLIQWGAPVNRTKVLRMGIDLPSSPIEFAKDVGRPLKVVSVGRLTEKKAHRDVLLAAHACNTPISLKIIGDGELSYDLHRLANVMRDSSTAISFLGARPHHETMAEIAAADVFVLPSVTASDGEMEGIPVVLMEAMAAGTLVISTRHSGIPELVTDRVSGFLVAEHDPEAIAAILEKISNKDYDLSGIRRSAFTKVSQQFNNAYLKKDIIDHVRSVVN